MNTPPRNGGTPPRKNSPPRNGRAHRASALLGTDARAARDRPRRVPSKIKDPKTKGLGAGAPLLNCSAESRRHAADGRCLEAADPAAAQEPRQPSLMPFLLTVAASTAIGYAVAKGLIRCGAPPRAVGWGLLPS